MQTPPQTKVEQLSRMFNNTPQIPSGSKTLISLKHCKLRLVQFLVQSEIQTGISIYMRPTISKNTVYLLSTWNVSMPLV